MKRIKQKKICLYQYYIFYGEGGRAVLDLSLILFIKSELLCRYFAPLSNSKILFHKIAVRSNTAIFKPALHLTGAQMFTASLCSSHNTVLKIFYMCWDNILLIEPLISRHIRPSSPFLIFYH